jgi:hypothetical protein
MKLVLFSHDGATPVPGILVDGGIVDISSVVEVADEPQPTMSR